MTNELKMVDDLYEEVNSNLLYRIPSEIILSDGMSHNRCLVFAYLVKNINRSGVVAMSLNNLIKNLGYSPSNRRSLSDERYIGYKVRCDLEWLSEKGYFNEFNIDDVVRNEYIEIQINRDKFTTDISDFGIIYDFEIRKALDKFPGGNNRVFVGHMITILSYIRMKMMETNTNTSSIDQHSYICSMSNISEMLGIPTSTVRKVLKELSDLYMLKLTHERQVFVNTLILSDDKYISGSSN